MLLLANTQTISYADTKCSFVLAKCDAALQAKNKEIELGNQSIEQSKVLNAALADRVTRAEDKLSAWYRSPTFLIVVGVLGGFFAARQLSK